MAQYVFEELNEDDMLEMLKYMPIKEHVRFERINTSWAHLLERLWLSQRHLQFGTEGYAECHPIALNDRCPDYKNDLPAELLLKVIKRCKNLKALEIHSQVLYHLNIELANALNDNCRQLEHLSIWSIHLAFFEVFIPSDKFTCLVNIEYDGVKLLHDQMKSRVELLSFKVVNYCRGVKNIHPLTWALINKETVEHLIAFYWNDKYNELINLKWLEVLVGNSDQIGNFHQLEHVALKLATNTGLRRIFKNNRKLVSLRLFGEADNAMATLVEFGTNLKKLQINFKQATMFNQFWQNVAEFTKLRSLYIRSEEEDSMLNTKINIKTLIVVLETCTKLKFFEFKCRLKAEDITTETEKDQIRKLVADKSFRQSFVVNFSSGYGPHCITVELGQ